jgi:hypothetical protein
VHVQGRAARCAPRVSASSSKLGIDPVHFDIVQVAAVGIWASAGNRRSNFAKSDL